jgi:hypothetical protein
MSEWQYGDALAQEIAKRIARPVANEAALSSVPTDELVAGRLYICIAEKSMWICGADEAAPSRLPGQGIGLFGCASGVAVGEWVYISAANTVAEADADDATKRPAIGVVVAKPSTTSCLVQMSGEYTTSGLTAGAAYYLSAATAGAITATPPAGNAQLVGIAKSTTVLLIFPQAAAFETAPQLNIKRTVRGVALANVADLNAFTVSDNGITYVEGNRILLAAQTTGAQNGIYVVGAVDAGSAPLTRAADMPTGYALPLGTVVETGPEGTEYASSSWKATATTAGGAVIGTNDPLFYPRNFRKTITLAAGTYTIGAGGGSESLFLKSTTASMVNITRNTAGGTLTGTVMYVAPVANRTAGIAGAAAVVVRSAVEAGTIQNQDTSTLDVLITNW